MDMRSHSGGSDEECSCNYIRLYTPYSVFTQALPDLTNVGVNILYTKYRLEINIADKVFTISQVEMKTVGSVLGHNDPINN